MLAGALANADRALDALARAGKRLHYAENWVYGPNIRKAARLIERSGGAILRVVGEESHSGTHSPYARQWRYSGGGSLFNKGCHPLGAALALKYAEGERRWGRPIRPARVVAWVASLTKPPHSARKEKFIRTGWDDCEDWGAMLLTFDDGTVAQITASDIVLGGIQNCLLGLRHARGRPRQQRAEHHRRRLHPARRHLRRRVHPREGRDDRGLAVHQRRRALDERLPGRIAGLLRGRRRRPRTNQRGDARARCGRGVVWGYLAAAEGRAVELGPYLR